MIKVVFEEKVSLPAAPFAFTSKARAREETAPRREVSGVDSGLTGSEPQMFGVKNE